MTENGEAAVRAVALACIGSERIREARQGRSRRALGKKIGIPGVVISDIEDASVLPSQEQVRLLGKELEVDFGDVYEPARGFGEIPWLIAIEQVLKKHGASTTSKISRVLASQLLGCKPGMVQWRLSRELSRLEGSGVLQSSTDGQWSLQGNSGSGKSRNGTSSGPIVEHAFRGVHDPELDAFFHIESAPGCRDIVLNGEHPLAPDLREILDLQISEETPNNELRRALQAASGAVRTLLIAWSELEESEKHGTRRDRLRETRQEWGRVARRVVELRDSDRNTT